MGIILQTVLLASLSVSIATAGETKEREARSAIRAWVISHSRGPIPAIEPGENDAAADLVDRLSITSLAEMEKRGLLRAELPSHPWSDYYWPTYAGQLANRYADPNFNAALLWKNNYEYLSRNIGQGPAEALSPAEKYDRLIGDGAFSLTNRMIADGQRAADENGKVETWFGLCHGWAAASMMLPRPAKAITVAGADGQPITFLPADIKALGTLLWANGAGRTRFVGGRCNDPRPGRDRNSRETNPDCFDTNPATWHLSVVNQIGMGKRSFVMDASAGSEVWNQPVLGYHYSYANPVTDEGGTSLAEAKVRLGDIRRDPYAKHRSPKAEFLVNVVMRVDYMAENTPTTARTDSPKIDSVRSVMYSYDLELDADDQIVGGEWHSSLHPDFLWVPVAGSKASSAGDDWLNRRGDTEVWNPGQPVPADWAKVAAATSSRGQPLARIVEELFRLSGQ